MGKHQGERMGSESKSKSTAKATAAELEAETQDEIAQIMSEIQTLQQNMSQSQRPRLPSSARMRAVPSEEPVESPVPEETGMDEFRGSGDEPSMEETLGAMKDEPSGPTLLDSAIESDGSSQEADGLPDATIAEEMDMATGTAEEPIEEPAIEEPAIEEPPIEEHSLQEETPEESPVATGVDDAHADTEITEEEENMTRPEEPTQAGVLAMTLAGNMTLRLRYVSGLEVSLSFSGQFLVVRLSDGSEFKLPLSRRQAA